jgi:hypothetical protein
MGCDLMGGNGLQPFAFEGGVQVVPGRFRSLGARATLRIATTPSPRSAEEAFMV